MKKLPEWVDITLRFAGIINVIWGLTFALFANVLFRWAALAEPEFLFPWQLIGIAAIVFGIAYYIASFGVVRNALLIAMGFVSKLVGAILVWSSVLTQDFSYQLALYFSVKDALWVVPFGAILYCIYKNEQWNTGERSHSPPDGEALFNGDRPNSV